MADTQNLPLETNLLGTQRLQISPRTLLWFYSSCLCEGEADEQWPEPRSLWTQTHG